MKLAAAGSRSILLLAFLLAPAGFVSAQAPAGSATEADLLDGRRQDPAALRDFFRRMPKGGDLHHHLSGSIPAEDMIRLALEGNLSIEPETLKLVPAGSPASLPLQELLAQDGARDRVIDAWTTRAEAAAGRLAADHFFTTFGKFGRSLDGREVEMLRIVRRIASGENTSYLETLVSFPTATQQVSQMGLDIGWKEKEGDLLAALLERGLGTVAETLALSVDEFHMTSLGEGIVPGTAQELEAGPLVRYQVYAGRTREPEAVFAQLALACEIALRTDLVVGINLVGPEHHPRSLADHAKHVHMLGFLVEHYGMGKKFSLALHAGELVPRLVPPGFRDSHVRDAVKIAGARRVGHGVDILQEEEPEKILALLRDEKIAIEVPLTSNEHLLGIRNGAHPLLRYVAAGVPVTLSTDDAGVLDTTLTEQFALAATRYPTLRYAEFREMARNSLRHSFLPAALRARMELDLEGRLARFEDSLAKP